MRHDGANAKFSTDREETDYSAYQATLIMEGSEPNKAIAKKHGTLSQQLFYCAPAPLTSSEPIFKNYGKTAV